MKQRKEVIQQTLWDTGVASGFVVAKNLAKEAAEEIENEIKDACESFEMGMDIEFTLRGREPDNGSNLPDGLVPTP